MKLLILHTKGCKEHLVCDCSRALTTQLIEQRIDFLQVGLLVVQNILHHHRLVTLRTVLGDMIGTPACNR